MVLAPAIAAVGRLGPSRKRPRSKRDKVRVAG
jgi:hypothetical protein